MTPETEQIIFEVWTQLGGHARVSAPEGKMWQTFLVKLIDLVNEHDDQGDKVTLLEIEVATLRKHIGTILEDLNALRNKASSNRNNVDVQPEVSRVLPVPREDSGRQDSGTHDLGGFQKHNRSD